MEQGVAGTSVAPQTKFFFGGGALSHVLVLKTTKINLTISLRHEAGRAAHCHKSITDTIDTMKIGLLVPTIEQRKGNFGKSE